MGLSVSLYTCGIKQAVTGFDFGSSSPDIYSSVL